MKNNQSGEETILATGFFVAIGHTPNTAIFKDYIGLDDQGTSPNKTWNIYTNVDGVFWAEIVLTRFTNKL